MSNTTTLFDPANVVRDTSALLGPQTAGWQFGFVVYGSYLTLHASYIRSEAYRRLALQVKLVLWVVFSLVLVYEVLAYTDIFRYMILFERTPQDIILGWWVDFIVSLIAGMVAAVVQVFLTIRASVLIRYRRIQLGFLIMMGMLILASFTGAILTTATSFMYYNNTIDKVSISFNQSVAIWLWSAAGVDVAISLSLLVTLKQRYAGSTNAASTTDSLLRKLIIVSLQTAAYTSFLAVAGAVVSLVFKDSNPAFALLHFAFWTPLPPCYAVSLYTTLSTRRHLDHHLGATGYALDADAGGEDAMTGFRASRLLDPIATREIAPFVRDGDGVSAATLGPHRSRGGGGPGGGGGGGWSQTGLYSPTIFALWDESTGSGGGGGSGGANANGNGNGNSGGGVPVSGAMRRNSDNKTIAAAASSLWSKSTMSTTTRKNSGSVGVGIVGP